MQDADQPVGQLPQGCVVSYVAGSHRVVVGAAPGDAFIDDMA